MTPKLFQIIMKNTKPKVYKYKILNSCTVIDNLHTVYEKKTQMIPDLEASHLCSPIDSRYQPLKTYLSGICSYYRIISIS